MIRINKAVIFGMTDAGFWRERNEDFLLYSKIYRSDFPGERVFAVVCDGMGGHQAGSTASRKAARAIQAHLADISEGDGASEGTCEIVQNSILRGHQAVLAEANRLGVRGDMGTTAVVAYLDDDSCAIGWCGDSRCYLFRNGALTCITKDHSRVQELVDEGTVSEAAARNHPESHFITSFLGQSGEPRIEASAFKLEDHDLILLTTDGLTNELGDREISAICIDLYPGNAQAGVELLQTITETLIEHALAKGASDNITLVLMAAGQDQFVASSSDEIVYKFSKGK